MNYWISKDRAKQAAVKLVIELSWEEEKKRNKKGIKKVRKDWKRAEGAADMTPPFYPLHTFRSTCHDWSLTQA